MPFAPPVQPITADDATIRAALADAHIPPLLPALAYLTGELDLLRDELAPDPLLVLQPQAGLTAEQMAEARQLALDAIIRYRDGGCRAAPEPGPEEMLALMRFITGGVLSQDYVPMMSEELNLHGRDLRAPSWTKESSRDFRVVVIGAGMSGLVAAHRLQQAGVPYTVLEKNDEVGGTWYENTYPGCRVDVVNQVYSYSFAQPDWPQFNSSQPVLLDYFQQVADQLGLRDHIRFSTEVSAMAWDDDRSRWVLELITPDGETTIEANAVISAVGQLNRPKLPEIDGMASFTGPAFHSARWRHDVDLTGKQVAVIGTGASAAQLIPFVAEDAAHLSVFQRTAPWYGSSEEYLADLPDGLDWLFHHIPHYREWCRFWLFWRGSEGLLTFMHVDPDWDGGEASVSFMNNELRKLLTAAIEEQFADRPDLLPAVVPWYPPGGKRILRDGFTWANALKRDDVELVTDEIVRITPEGIVTADGCERSFDVIIYGTGFHASQFLTPMKVVGRDGIELHDQWDGNARAYLGVTAPNFPNFFFLYGPNTNIVVNGSIIFFSECEVHYILECLRLLFERDAAALDCRADVHDAYNERIDAGNEAMAWGASSVNSWYKSPSGRVAQNWPFSLLEYWQQTRAPDPDDYVWSPS